MRAALLTVLLSLAVSTAQGQFVRYSFTGALGSEPTFAPDAQPAGATASPMRRGTGLTPSGAADAFSASGFPVAAARDTAAYYSFTITPDAGQTLNYTQILLDERRSGTGPRTWALYTSRDGYAAPVARVDVPDNTDTRLNTEIPLGPAFSGSAPLTFRLYAFGAEATTGTWRIDNVRLDAATPTTGPSIRFGTAPTSVAESAASARLVLLLTEPSATEATTVRLRATGGTATAGQDYPVADTLLRVPAGATSLDVLFPLRDDAAIEPDETIVLTLDSPSRGALAAPTTFTLTLVDDDRPPTVRFAQSELTVDEDAGAVSVALVLEGPAPTAGATVRLTLGTGGTATVGRDFDLPTADVQFAAGQATAFATLPLYADAETEPTETAVLGLQIVSGAPTLQVGTPATFTLRLRDRAPAGPGSICPGQVGSALMACLKAAFSRTTVVSYNQARDFLYGEFYPGPPYTGVYTGRTGPRGGGGSTVQLDTEHTWPQSKMPDEPTQEGEMHNLFPTISKVNNDRGNLPFGEIADSLATGWYCPTGTLPQAAPPATGRELCSEIVAGVRFEPREDHKGNVARTLAYFATIYTPTATSTAFLRDVQPIFVLWNRLDPPDDAERARSAFIRTKQGNDNPYILDTTLVRRAFASPVAADAAQRAALSVTMAPNPARATTTLSVTLPGAARVSVSVFDALGRRVLLLPFEEASGAFTRTLDVADLAPGVYFVHLRGEGAAPFARTLPLIRAR